MEVVGSAASVIALIGIAGQSAKVLWDFWSALKDCPADIRSFSRDLQILNEVLESIRRDLNQSPGLNQVPLVRRSLEDCIRFLEELKNLVKPFQSTVLTTRTRRAWSSIKAAFHEDKVNRFRRNLEATKCTLLLATTNMNK